ARREEERDVVQAGDAVGLRGAAGGLPRVEAEVVVVAAGRDEEDVSRRAPAGNVARLEDDVEAEEVDVERAHAIDVGGPQVHVADPHVRVDRPLRAEHRLVRALRAAHDPASTTCTALSHGSRATMPPTAGSTCTPARSSRSRTACTSAAAGSSIVQ